MTQINRLVNKVKRLKEGNRLSVMIFVEDDEVRISYFIESIEGVVSNSGGECFSKRSDVDDFLADLMEKYHIFSKNCYIWEFINDLEE